MRHLRLLIIALATIFVLAFAAYALINRPLSSGGDVIVIKGGSLSVQCLTTNANTANDPDCLPFNGTDKVYKHKNGNGKIEAIIVRDSSGRTLKIFTRSADFSDGKPSVEISYK